MASHRGVAYEPPPHPDSPDVADIPAVRRWVREAARRGPTAVDLFAGAGGLSLGLRDAGFTVLVGADNDRHAALSHAGNIGGLTFEGDLGDEEELDTFLARLGEWGVRRVDLVAGGPPCQPFSRAGSSKIRSLVRQGARHVEDPRAQLWRSFMAVVRHLKPRAVLIENVPDLPSWDDGAVLIGFYEELRAEGYEVEARVLDAFRHGVPQHRARLFIVALEAGREFSWPKEQPRAPTLGEAIGDLPPVGPAHRQERTRYRSKRWDDGHVGKRPSALQRRLRRDVARSDRDIVFDHITRDVRPDDAIAFSALPQGGTYLDIPEELRRYRSDIFTDKYKRLSWGEVSRSITAHIAKDGYWYIHPDQDRTLSIREAARIQTFPDWFRFAGQPTHRLKQIGNAVPPLLGEALGRSLLAALSGPKTRRSARDDTAFREDLLAWHSANARRFPWREQGISAWEVLMAEMCLHRTRADQVAPVFRRLQRQAPTPRHMVEDPAGCLEAMKSLGLRWRAENIIEVARVLESDFDGEVPSDELALRSLPGVGDYVAQAVLCFGFGRRSVLVDTNTVRIVGRVNGREDGRRWQLRLDLHRLAGPRGPDAALNYALLDLGALVCPAGKPKCHACPVREHCVTGAGVQPPPQMELATVS